MGACALAATTPEEIAAPLQCGQVFLISRKMPERKEMINKHTHPDLFSKSAQFRCLFAETAEQIGAARCQSVHGSEQNAKIILCCAGLLPRCNAALLEKCMVCQTGFPFRMCVQHCESGFY